MKIKTVMGICLLALMIGIFLWYGKDFAKAFSLLRKQLTLGLAFGIIFFTILHFGNEPLRWWAILRKQQPPLSLTSIYHTASATALISYTFPARFGLPTRLVMAKKVLGLDYMTASAVLIIDSFSLYGTWLMVGMVGGTVLVPAWNVKTPVIVVIIITGIVTFLFFFTRYGQCHWYRFAWLSKYVQQFSSVLNQVSINIVISNVTLLIMDIFIYGIRHTLILSALGVECSLLKVTAVVAISVFAGFISLMPLGLGGYDLSLIFLLTMIGVPRKAAMATPLINRIAMLSVVLILGSISFSRLGITRDKIRKMKENNTKDLS